METAPYKDIVKKGTTLLISAVLASLVTLILVAVFAFILLRTDLSAGTVNIGLIVISVISCFAGGFFCGKKVKKRSFLWGLFTGILYFALLLLLRLLFGQNLTAQLTGNITAFLYCAGSGMLGGMIS